MNYSPFVPLIRHDGQRMVRATTFVALPGMAPWASATGDAALFKLNGSSAALTIEDGIPDGACKLLSSSTNPAGLQANGENFALASDVTIAFETTLYLTDSDGMSFVAGLGITNTDPWTTSWTDWIGFYCVNSTTIRIGCAKNSAGVPGSGAAGLETNSAVISTINTPTFADATYVTLAFVVHGTDRVKFYVNQEYAGTISSTLPDDEQLTPTIAIVGSAESVFVRNMVVAANRYSIP